VREQELALRRHPDIVVATPGRLIDLLRNTPAVSLAALETLVLDEADRPASLLSSSLPFLTPFHSRSRPPAMSLHFAAASAVPSSNPSTPCSPLPPLLLPPFPPAPSPASSLLVLPSYSLFLRRNRPAFQPQLEC